MELKNKTKRNISLTKPNQTKNQTKNKKQGSRPTADRLSGVSSESRRGGRRGCRPHASIHQPQTARAPSGYVMVSLRRVPAPIRVFHHCSTSVAAQLFSGGLLLGDAPQGTTTTQNPGSPSTPTLWFFQTLVGWVDAPGPASRPGLPDGAARTHCCIEPP